MKAISLYQPWAILTVLSEKRYETRSWSTAYRGPLAICSSKRKVPIWKWPPIGKVIEALCRAGLGLDDLKYGHALGIVNLAEIFRTDCLHVDPEERIYGNFSPARFAWRLDHVKRLLTPLPVKGRQGLFEIDWQGEKTDTDLLKKGGETECRMD